MKPGSEILVSCAKSHRLGSRGGKRFVHKRHGSERLSKEMIHRGAREVIVDLCNCPVMDSTFMGTLLPRDYSSLIEQPRMLREENLVDILFKRKLLMD